MSTITLGPDTLWTAARIVSYYLKGKDSSQLTRLPLDVISQQYYQDAERRLASIDFVYSPFGHGFVAATRYLEEVLYIQSLDRSVRSADLPKIPIGLMSIFANRHPLGDAWVQNKGKRLQTFLSEAFPFLTNRHTQSLVDCKSFFYGSGQDQIKGGLVRPNQDYDEREQLWHMMWINNTMGVLHLYCHLEISTRTHDVLRCLPPENPFTKTWHTLTWNQDSAGRTGGKLQFTKNESLSFRAFQVPNVPRLTQSITVDLDRPYAFVSTHEAYNADGRVLYEAFTAFVQASYDGLKPTHQHELDQATGSHPTIMYLTNLLWYDSVMHHVYHHPFEVIYDRLRGSLSLEPGHTVEEMLPGPDKRLLETFFLLNVNLPLSRSLLDESVGNNEHTLVFYQCMQQAATVIQHRNESRRTPFNLFNPAFVPLSLSY